MMVAVEENPRPTQLLISVRSAVEAELAVAGGVRMLDVKEPLRGPLGAASAEICQSVLEVAGDATVSAALGELLDYQVGQFPGQLSLVPGQLSLAKFGLSGCQSREDWPHLWRTAIRSLPVGVGPVAVIYADHSLAAAPKPAEVLAVGRELGCRYVLVDTFDKTRGNLLDLWSWGEIQKLVEQVQSQGLRIVLAGSLSASCIRRLLPLKPAVVAVRGAACGGDRNGSLSAECVSELVALVQGSRTNPTSPRISVAR